MRTVNGYDISICELVSSESLEREWSALEERASNSFFLSWAWVGVWLDTFKPKADILRAFSGGELVGLAVLVRSAGLRHSFLRSNIINLNQTGDPIKDQIWIEYNGILTDSKHEKVVGDCLTYLLEHYKNWDELIIGAITEEQAKLFSSNESLTRQDLWKAPSFGVDLKEIRANSASYFDILSRNTRYQIRRSRRRYESMGPLTLTTAKSVDSALSLFDEIGPLHRERWGSGPDQSGFANPLFVEFHRALIKRAWPKGMIDVSKVSVGNQAIAYFYSFKYKHTVYFYLSGIQAVSDPQLKPGLLGHSLCIEKYLDEGCEYYDFMGGGERYKSSLGSKSQNLYKITLQRSLPKFRLERYARKLKRAIVIGVEQ